MSHGPQVRTLAQPALRLLREHDEPLDVHRTVVSFQCLLVLRIGFQAVRLRLLDIPPAAGVLWVCAADGDFGLEGMSFLRREALIRTYISSLTFEVRAPHGVCIKVACRSFTDLCGRVHPCDEEKLLLLA
jgi:hypothetical protein